MKNDNPTIRMITEDAETVKKRCQKLLRKIQKIDGIDTEMVESEGKIGGGSYPLDVKKTYSVKLGIFRKRPRKRTLNPRS